MAVIRIRPYEPPYAHEAAKMWRLSKEEAIGQKEIHSFESHVQFLDEVLPKEYQIHLAFEDKEVVGLVVFYADELNQLYVAPAHQGKGIGKQLLNFAKAHSGGSLFLYTFEVNRNAQRFYEKNGFVEIGRGYENEENLPDIKYEWKESNVSD
ncbi:GNAT family N-acetyltransferase [Planococcus sp. FY231025]|uniref:GNAT family N-acetyltransferase n=1 Tax=Planococcus sp. FY231025 TaxID=3455699 RepID=UPI003F8D9852